MRTVDEDMKGQMQMSFSEQGKGESNRNKILDITLVCDKIRRNYVISRVSKGSETQGLMQHK